MNIIVLGPKGVGKTTFINKMFAKYGEEIKKHIIESDAPLHFNPEEITQSYMILPNEEVLRQRCPHLNIEEEMNKWINYYNDYSTKYTVAWVSDF